MTENEERRGDGVHITNREIYEKVIQIGISVDHLVIDSRNFRHSQGLLVRQFKQHDERLGTLETFKAVVLGVLKVLAVAIPIGIPILLFALSH